VPDDDRLITEAECRAWVLAEQFTAALPDEAREAGIRVEWTPGSDEPDAGETLSPEQAASVQAFSRQLLDDIGSGFDIGDYLRRALNGELPPKAPDPPPKRHRCLACWLVSLLPGHGRCEHGWLESGCEECGDCW
jgi:hypothetical protein